MPSLSSPRSASLTRKSAGSKAVPRSPPPEEKQCPTIPIPCLLLLTVVCACICASPFLGVLRLSEESPSDLKKLESTSVQDSAVNPRHGQTKSISYTAIYPALGNGTHDTDRINAASAARTAGREKPVAKPPHRSWTHLLHRCRVLHRCRLLGKNSSTTKSLATRVPATAEAPKAANATK